MDITIVLYTDAGRNTAMFFSIDFGPNSSDLDVTYCSMLGRLSVMAEVVMEISCSQVGDKLRHTTWHCRTNCGAASNIASPLLPIVAWDWIKLFLGFNTDNSFVKRKIRGTNGKIKGKMINWGTRVRTLIPFSLSSSLLWTNISSIDKANIGTPALIRNHPITGATLLPVTKVSTNTPNENIRAPHPMPSFPAVLGPKRMLIILIVGQ